MSVIVRLKKSLIGASKNQIAVANSLGLKRVGDFSVQPKSRATEGKILKITHMLEVSDK